MARTGKWNVGQLARERFGSDVVLVGFTTYEGTLDTDAALGQKLRSPRHERAIGVVNLPQTERVSHYFDAKLSEQFDAVIHVDRTRAVEPLERTARWRNVEPPETYPFAV